MNNQVFQNFYQHVDENGVTTMIPFETAVANSYIANEHGLQTNNFVAISDANNNDKLSSTVVIEQKLVDDYFSSKHMLETDQTRRKELVASLRKQKAQLISMVAKLSHLFVPQTLNSVAIDNLGSKWLTKIDKKPSKSISRKCLLWIISKMESSPNDCVVRLEQIDKLLNTYHTKRNQKFEKEGKHSQLFDIKLRTKDEFQLFRASMAKKRKIQKEKIAKMSESDLQSQQVTDAAKDRKRYYRLFQELVNNPDEIDVKL